MFSNAPPIHRSVSEFVARAFPLISLLSIDSLQRAETNFVHLLTARNPPHERSAFLIIAQTQTVIKIVRVPNDRPIQNTAVVEVGRYIPIQQTAPAGAVDATVTVTVTVEVQSIARQPAAAAVEPIRQI